jgi:hypothetical protein
VTVPVLITPSDPSSAVKRSRLGSDPLDRSLSVQLILLLPMIRLSPPAL